ncbi:MAG TPA: SAM-dependent methyltransferase [Chitinophagales bacterium]|nr:SAM-dependent methyltransferase [Chitinophagales bacterium]
MNVQTMAANPAETFLQNFIQTVMQGQFIKLTLSDKRNKEAELKNVFVKPVVLKQGRRLTFVYRYPTKDVTKNYDANEAALLVKALLEQEFFKADLFTATGDYHLAIDKSGKAILKHKPATMLLPEVTTHDHQKKRTIDAAGNVYLQQLGITTTDGKVKNDKQDKYRQINKYVEIAESIVNEAALGNNIQVTDMGSGKGYLTFALYDYLANTRKLSPHITGVELRKELVEKCNAIAKQSAFDGLEFKTGSIDTTELPATDMLIALHACDIATDQAIYRGITGGAKVIVCAPCCHKQIRKQLQPQSAVSPVTRFGILEERQAEILTDTIRALILEAYGYKTKVFEFISTEHTPKNVLITAIKSRDTTIPDPKVLGQINSLKQLFGIKQHELERLMGLV